MTFSRTDLFPCLDLVTLLRQQLVEHPISFATAKAPATYQTMVGAAAA
jgi:hypothetical protein